MRGNYDAMIVTLAYGSSEVTPQAKLSGTNERLLSISLTKKKKTFVLTVLSRCFGVVYNSEGFGSQYMSYKSIVIVFKLFNGRIK